MRGGSRLPLRQAGALLGLPAALTSSVHSSLCRSGSTCSSTATSSCERREKIDGGASASFRPTPAERFSWCARPPPCLERRTTHVNILSPKRAFTGPEVCPAPLAMYRGPPSNQPPHSTGLPRRRSIARLRSRRWRRLRRPMHRCGRSARCHCESTFTRWPMSKSHPVCRAHSPRAHCPPPSLPRPFWCALSDLAMAGCKGCVPAARTHGPCYSLPSSPDPALQMKAAQRERVSPRANGASWTT
jgi:hypothetical protein